MSRVQITFSQAMLSSATDNPRCPMCDYSHDSSNGLLCVRYAPRPILDSISYPFRIIWPSVSSSEFCGDFVMTVATEG